MSHLRPTYSHTFLEMLCQRLAPLPRNVELSPRNILLPALVFAT